MISDGQNFKTRPQCFSHDKLIPKTWLLDDKANCQSFFNILNSPGYEEAKTEREIIFIRKIASRSNEEKGSKLVNKAEEDELKSIYVNGNQCGIVKKNYIVQKYIENALLLNGHKFEFKAFLLIASTDPMIAYYHDGFLKVNLTEHFSQVQGETLKQAQQWSYQRLQDYLIEKRIIIDPNWLDNYLRPQLKKAMIHLLRMTGSAFRKDKTTFELFGVDFLLDANLNLWFMEVNTEPHIEDYSLPMERFIVKMMKDHFEIAYGILKSRMKRVVIFVNGLIQNDGVIIDVDGEVEIKSLDVQRRKFREISKNYFEKEFEPKDTNGFKKIIDANSEGIHMYQGLINPECL